MKKYAFVIVIFVITVIVYKDYTSHDFSHTKTGWVFNIPLGWKRIETEELVDRRKKGNKLIVDSGAEISTDEIEYILSIKKNNANVMLVTLDDSSVTEEQFWSNNVHSIIDNTNKIYFQVTDNIDLKSTVYVYIDGRKFAHSELAVMNDRGIKVIEVFTYVTILPVGIFSAIIVSDNDKDKIINLLLDSKFLN